MRVLIVDDLAPMRSVAKKMLQHMRHFEVIDEAGGGEEAWEKITACEGPEIYDLVICDIKMDEGTGIELLKRCRNHPDFRYIPFIMISASSEPANIAAALGEWGANDFIVKPFSYEILEKRVDSLFKRLKSPEEALFRQVERLKQTGASEEALELIEEAETEHRLSLAKWLNAKGECLMAAGDTEGAAAEFEKAMGISKIFVAAYKNYAAAQHKMGNMAKAVEAMEYIEKVSPTDKERTFLLGKLLLVAGRKEEGKRCIKNLVKRCQGKEKETLVGKAAQVFLEAGLFEEAKEMYMMSLDFNPSDLETINRLGLLLRQQGKFDEAVQCYLSALKKHHDHAGLHHNLGVLYVSRKDYKTGRAYLQRALLLDPRFDEAKAMLQRLDQMENGKS
jgi:CheY-like chemotaxis protein